MKKTAQGFTLVELLVVIAIIAILAAIVVLIINPLELLRRSRDAARLTDLANLQQAINVAVQEASNSGTAILCSRTNTYPCSGNSLTSGRASNGTGWVQVNLGANASVSVPTLPVDPTNSSTYHYVYCADGPSSSDGVTTDAWEIDTKLESQQQSPKMQNDGGDDSFLFEVGSNLGLISDSANGVVGKSGATCSY